MSSFGRISQLNTTYQAGADLPAYRRVKLVDGELQLAGPQDVELGIVTTKCPQGDKVSVQLLAQGGEYGLVLALGSPVAQVGDLVRRSTDGRVTADTGGGSILGRCNKTAVGCKDFCYTVVDRFVSDPEAAQSGFVGEVETPQALEAQAATAGSFARVASTQSLFAFDVEQAQWVDTQIGGSVADEVVIGTTLEHTYAPDQGTGYGFADAQAGRWEITPLGNAQCIAGSYANCSYIRFARLQQPGDRVVLNDMSYSQTASPNQRRFQLVGVHASANPNFKSNQGTWANASFSQISDTPENLEFAMSWIGAYFNFGSYGPGLTPLGPAGNAAPADPTNFDLEFCVRTDYRIEVKIDGEVRAVTTFVPNAASDLYFVASPTNILPAPAGEVTTAPGNTTPPPPGTTPHWMSLVGTTGTSVAQGNGYFLYTADAPVDSADIQLTDEECMIAMTCRVFQDYSGMSVEEVAESNAKVAKKDRKVLTKCKELAQGWFHAQDLTLAEIQSKLTLYTPALQAADAGSVELCMAALEALPAVGGTASEFYYTPHSVIYGNFDGSPSYSWRSTYGDSVYDDWGINYFYVIDDDAGQQKIRIQFTTETKKNEFKTNAALITFLGFNDLTDLTLIYEEQLKIEIAYSDAGAVLNECCIWGGSPLVGIAAAGATTDDALNSELKAKLAKHLRKFPR